jgi:peroxiredoxin
MKSPFIGRSLPSCVGRTDEGTPVSLQDFRGRALAVFPGGEEDGSLARFVAHSANKFLALEVSAIVIATCSEDDLAALRSRERLPMVMLSDFSRDIHRFFECPQKGFCPAFLADEEGHIAAAISPSAPEARVRAVLEAASRLRQGKPVRSRDPGD